MEKLHHQMVLKQLRERGIKDEIVLEAMANVLRHLFIDKKFHDSAYEDGPLPIGYNQTISQPYIVAYMTERLQVQPQHTVLEVGCGSGYQAAILSHLARKVISLERIPELAKAARKRLHELGYTNVEVLESNGWFGWPEKAPFDRIIVTAAAKKIPKALIDQLDNGGIMIIPVGKRVFSQSLEIVRKDFSGKLTKEISLPVRFVTLKEK